MKTEWNGGEYPVKADERAVKVWFRHGVERILTGDGSNLRWSHAGRGGDIIAYETEKRGDA